MKPVFHCVFTLARRSFTSRATVVVCLCCYCCILLFFFFDGFCANVCHCDIWFARSMIPTSMFSWAVCVFFLLGSHLYILFVLSSNCFPRAGLALAF